MGFLNPILFIFLLSFIPVIILYLLKKEHEEVKISSTFLWDKVIKDIEVNKPFQRLNKHILLFIQLAVLLFLVLFLVKPFIYTEEALYSEVIIVIDNSLSMSKTDKDISLLDLAKDKAKEVIKKGSKTTSHTVITYSSSTNSLIKQSSNKSEVLNIIGDIKITPSADDVDRVTSIIDGYIKADPNVKVVFYTDKNITFKYDNISLNVLNYNVGNAAITSVVHIANESGLELLVTLANFDESNSVTADLILYNNNDMIDVKEVVLDSKIVNETFKLTSEEFNNISVKLDIKDSIELDNVRYYNVQNQKTNKVLLVSDGNLYLEKALSILANVDLYKTSEIDKEFSGYDLYVFDSIVAEVLPVDGNLFFVNPQSDTEYFSLGETLKTANVEILETELTNNINEKFIVENGREIISEDLTSNVLYNKLPLIVSGQGDKVKVVAMGFSVFHSDLAIKIAFPILIQNIVDYTLSNHKYVEESVLVDELVSVNLHATCLEANIKDPQGKVTKIAPPFPNDDYDKTKNVGLYTLIQTLKSETVSTYFSVNVDTNSESNTKYEEVISNQTSNNETISQNVKKDFAKVMLIIALILLLIEWGVYTNDNRVY